jgi:hypothetical protein
MYTRTHTHTHRKPLWCIVLSSYNTRMLQAKYENYAFFTTPLYFRQSVKYQHFYHVDTYVPNYTDHIPEVCNIHIQCLENLKSHICITYCVHYCLEDWNSTPGLLRNFSRKHAQNSSKSHPAFCPMGKFLFVKYKFSRAVSSVEGRI